MYKPGSYISKLLLSISSTFSFSIGSGFIVTEASGHPCKGSLVSIPVVGDLGSSLTANIPGTES